MFVQFVIVDSLNGEFHRDCNKCGRFIVKLADTSKVVDEYPVPKGHMIVEITPEENDEARQLDYDHNKKEVFHKFKIDTVKAKKHIKDREVLEEVINMHGVHYIERKPVKITKDAID